MRYLLPVLAGAIVSSCAGGMPENLPPTNVQNVPVAGSQVPNLIRRQNPQPRIGPYLFVLNGGNELFTIDETTNKVVHHVVLGGCGTLPGPIALTPDRKHLYIATDPVFYGAVLVYDPFRDRIDKSIAVPLASLGATMTLTHDGNHLYVAGNQLTDINARTNKVRATVALPGAGPDGDARQLLVSDVSDNAYVAIENIAYNYEDVYNPASHSVVQYTLPSASFLDSSAITPDGTMLYVSVFQTLYAIATSTMTPTQSLTEGPYPFLGISPNGANLFALGFGFSGPGIQEYTLSSLQLGPSLPTPATGYGFIGTAFNGNGTRLYTGYQGDVYVIDAANLHVIKAIPLHYGGVNSLISQ